MKDIVQDGDAVLRAMAEPVSEREFGSTELNQILKDMGESLDAQKDGVAIAAPQIGVSKRIFLVRYDRMREPEPGAGGEEPQAHLGVYINPSITRVSKRMDDMPEGCLSVRGRYGTTHRHVKATVRAQDSAGTWFVRGAGGILAQAFQHETDHLNGILFIDHAQEVHEQTATEERALDYHERPEPHE